MRTFTIVLALVALLSLASAYTVNNYAANMIHTEKTGSVTFPGFIDSNPVTTEAFVKSTMGRTQVEYAAMEQRALDFFTNDYELTNCAKNSVISNAPGALWGTCDNAIIRHVHFALDSNGNSIYGVRALNWDGTDYKSCQLDAARKLDALFIAFVTNSYNLTSGLVVPAGQGLPNGMYVTDCIKNGCSSSSQFITPIVEYYHQSIEGIGGAGESFLCDVCSPTLDNCATVGQVFGVMPVTRNSATPGTVIVHTGAQTFYPKPF